MGWEGKGKACRYNVNVTFVFIQKFDSKSRMTSFCCLEIHVVSSATGAEEPQSRVFVHSGVLERKATVCGCAHGSGCVSVVIGGMGVQVRVSVCVWYLGRMYVCVVGCLYRPESFLFALVHVCVRLCVSVCLSVCLSVCVRVCVQDGEVGKKVCAHLATPLEAEQVYALLYRKHTTPPQALAKTDYIASQVGSNRLKKVPPHCVQW